VAAADLPTLPASARLDPDLTRLFTPSNVPAGTYRVFVSPDPVARVASFFRTSPGASSSEGAWRIQSLEPLQALGSAEPYDRSLVARLYTGKPVSVARGTVGRADHVTHSITLLSPHPDKTLSRLDPGTMIVVFDLGRLQGGVRREPESEESRR
jgi:hypothetical protein